MREVALGSLLLFAGMFVIWLAVMQYRYREAAGETPFDLIGAIIPPLKRPMLWASTAFLGLLGMVALIGAAVHFMSRWASADRYSGWFVAAPACNADL